MAKKIFRLHTDGVTEETGWFNSKPIDKNSLKTIKTKGKDVATSIPTPFATIDLVKSAFAWLADNFKTSFRSVSSLHPLFPRS